MAAVAHVSEGHFIRTFRAVFGETPQRYLQRRQVGRSMFLLREADRSVTDICLDVGFSSLGTFSRTFRDIVGETPSDYRLGHGPIVTPHCVQLAAMRPAGQGAAGSHRLRAQGAEAPLAARRYIGQMLPDPLVGAIRPMYQCESNAKRASGDASRSRRTD